jgi:very-short-patch-repair endonuclease
MNEEPLIKARLHFITNNRINYAMQQNDVAIVRTLDIENLTDMPLHELRLVIKAEPEFAEPWENRIDVVAERSTYKIEAVDIRLSPKYLGELTERVRGRLLFELYQGEELIDQKTEAIELLARDEWTGLASLPEILAAFVMPNYPKVEQVLKEAASILEKWTGNPSLAGYQGKDPKRAYMMAGSIYVALQQLGITYINPPASFEANGQRIRLPEQILESRMATCMDISLFAAGCLEQAGINPLIVIVRGHAFVGVWLQEECFGEAANEDPLRLRKRVDLDEIVVFDPTCVTSRPSPDFNGSVREAKRRLENPDEFLCAIDLARARKEQIRPLPERIQRIEPEPEHVPEDEAIYEVPPMPDLSELRAPTGSAVVSEAGKPDTPETRLDRWRRRLLDLTLRNRLLNFRDTKKTIPLLCPDIASFEDGLAEGMSFHILPRPRDFESGDLRDPEIYRRRTGEDAMEARLLEELRQRRLHADLTQEDLDRRCLEIYRASRLELEEGGASALYLALGFLLWYEAPQSSQPRIAPILLLPIELHRRSVREGFTFRLGDDDLHINVTLLELLKQDHGINIPGLDPLPEDHAGVDVPKILRIFRKAVRDIHRWDVLDIARIGIFSFAKFLMWRDLGERAEDLLNNPVVSHLVNLPDQEFDPGASFPNPDFLDEERPPLSTYCPLPADSSQLAAVFAAAEGRSFVLEGPPGTGKSQTITNVIAHCLADNKSVLFVSEKMAALNVVYDRLRKVGLEYFCLELHSNKVQKRAVLNQLEAALNYHTETSVTEEWRRQAQHIQKLRTQLNGYVNALHNRRGSGETVFQAISRLIGLRDVPQVELPWLSPDEIGPEKLSELRDLAKRLATAGAALGEVSGQPWEGVRRGEWTPNWEREVRTALNQFSSVLDKLETQVRELSTRTYIKPERWSLYELDLLSSLAELLLNSYASPPVLLVQPDWEDINTKIGDWLRRGRRRDALRSKIFEHFHKQILELDLENIRNCYDRACASWWPISWWNYRKVQKSFKSMAKGRKAPPRKQLTELLDQVQALHAEEQALISAGDEARALFGRYWKDGEADWEYLEEVREWVKNLRSLAIKIAGSDFSYAAELRKKWGHLLAEGQDLLKGDGAIGRELEAYRTVYGEFLEIHKALNALLEVDAEKVWGKEGDADALSRIRNILEAWSGRIGELRNWCAWLRIRSEAIQSDLTPLVESYERGDFKSTEFPRIFDRSYYVWWYSMVVSGEPELAQFFSPEHMRKIEQFREIDEKQLELSKYYIASRLGEKVPTSGGEDLPNSEIGILKREIGKKKKQMSVRKLFQAIPRLLPRLKPCLLMSPMSVAQYIDASFPPFDLVVFDEASQIPVWDAVGAIARGKQAVIVGDPKQLPPTSFFQRTEDEDIEATESETVEDLESILDDCISARLPELSLNWHYRSRHESLIAFSNYHYYNNRLLTFPSPHRTGLGVSWSPVPDGIYDRGRSATNRGEADAVVQEIVCRLKDKSLRDWTIGVVTFSQAQQTLIENLLEEIRREDHKIDTYFSEEAREPVFVKNLENVQGDERDVILFSICYGPDKMGRVSMNFGPLNREGGERRLNVAITRARREVKVFSTIRADQIDLARTRARGVRDLKNFLEYAERGPSVLEAAVQYDPDVDFDSPFEKAIHDVLVSRGWKVHKQVGCAKYRIDLAVVDPINTGRYLLGIECDGANYHRAKTARDRDKLREEVLRDLGWKLHRIWSTDWWSNPEHEISRLEAALTESLDAQERHKTVAIDRPDEKPTLKVAAQPQQKPIPPQEKKRPYPIYSPFLVKESLGKPETFYHPASDPLVRKVAIEIVNQEGPISLELTTRRVAAHWGIKRIYQKAINRVRSLLPRSRIISTTSPAGPVLWPEGMSPETFDIFRVPGEDPESFREAEDLPINEVANAALYLLKQHLSAPKDEVLREMSRLFGFRRTGPTVEDRMRKGLTFLIKKRLVRQEGKTIILEG